MLWLPGFECLPSKGFGCRLGTLYSLHDSSNSHRTWRVLPGSAGCLGSPSHEQGGGEAVASSSLTCFPFRKVLRPAPRTGGAFRQTGK
jgi:hypothetical protein